MKPKILIISNEAFSETSSNGRTMRNLLLNIPRENLAQFYLHGTPDREICNNFYCVSDRAALNAFLCKKARKSAPQISTDGKPVHQKAQPRPVRSYRNLVLRNIVWQSMRWWSKDFSGFLDAFNPDIILLQAGDAPFMYKIARRIARKYRAKLMMLNTEHYVLKRVMYANSGDKLFWHNILMCSLKKQYGKFMRMADHCIYNTVALEQAYQKAYPHPGRSSVLYTTSTLTPLPDHTGEGFSVLYCGNLGAGRCRPILELAEILQEVCPDARLDIFGKFPSVEAGKTICAKPNVCYHGVVEYEDLIPRMSEATMLVHCENRSRVENLKYAFSTKIADSLACGKPFLVYAPKEYPFVQYLAQNRCAHIADNAEELRDILQKCIASKAYLTQYVDNAQATAARNHNRERNCQVIEEIFTLS